MNLINKEHIERYNQCLSRLWNTLNGDSLLLDAIQFDGPEYVFPSRFDVTAFASTCFGSWPASRCFGKNGNGFLFF